ncbi:DMT family transporter [Rickettsiales bacterium]|nr:DMT family transporter [Rickettsiales bacterium]
MSDLTKGIFWAILSNFLMALMLILIRIASEDHHPFVIVFFRNLFALMIMFTLIYHQGFVTIKTNKLKLHFYRALVGIIAMLSWFYALANLKLSFATALSFSAPIFTAIAAAIYLKEKLYLRRISAILFGFVGTLIIINPTLNSANFYVYIVLFSTSLWALAAILIKNLTKTESSKSITYYMVLFMTPMSLPFALFFFTKITLSDLMIFFAIGAISNFAHFALTSAIRNTELSNILPVEFTKLIFVSFFAWIIFSEYVTLNEIIGSLIIIGSNIYLAFRQTQKPNLI